MHHNPVLRAVLPQPGGPILGRPRNVAYFPARRAHSAICDVHLARVSPEQMPVVGVQYVTRSSSDPCPKRPADDFVALSPSTRASVRMVCAQVKISSRNRLLSTASFSPRSCITSSALSRPETRLLLSLLGSSATGPPSGAGRHPSLSSGSPHRARPFLHKRWRLRRLHQRRRTSHLHIRLQSSHRR